MKILTKSGHAAVSEYLINLCKELSVQDSGAPPVDRLNLLSSNALCDFVKANDAWHCHAAGVIKSRRFTPAEVESKLSGLRYVSDSKNLSDFRASSTIYDALRELPAPASVDWALWSGLAFGPCSEYMKERWNVPALTALADSPVTGEGADEQEYLEVRPNTTGPIIRTRGILLQRWIGRGAGTTALTRHGIARLWWIARVADMASREQGAKGGSMQHYLRVLFADQNIQWSIVLRRYGAMSTLVSVLLDKIADEYLDKSGPEDEPYKLSAGKSINEIKQFTKLLNTSAGGSLYDLKQYDEMASDVSFFQDIARGYEA